MMKQIKATLKEKPFAATSLELDWKQNIFIASSLVEEAKRELLNHLKDALHDKIAVLSLDDIEFSVKDI